MGFITDPTVVNPVDPMFRLKANLVLGDWFVSVAGVLGLV